jgi:hypothetical protein
VKRGATRTRTGPETREWPAPSLCARIELSLVITRGPLSYGHHNRRTALEWCAGCLLDSSSGVMASAESTAARTAPKLISLGILCNAR